MGVTVNAEISAELVERLDAIAQGEGLKAIRGGQVHSHEDVRGEFDGWGG